MSDSNHLRCNTGDASDSYRCWWVCRSNATSLQNCHLTCIKHKNINVKIIASKRRRRVARFWSKVTICFFFIFQFRPVPKLGYVLFHWFLILNKHLDSSYVVIVCRFIVHPQLSRGIGEFSPKVSLPPPPSPPKKKLKFITAIRYNWHTTAVMEKKE